MAKKEFDQQSPEDERPKEKPAPRPAPARPVPQRGGIRPRAMLKASAASVAGVAKVALSPEAQALLKSSFSTGKQRAEYKAKLPGVWEPPAPGSEEVEPEAPLPEFDGETPAEELTSSDVWKAVRPPVESREGRRSGELYRQVLHQFAVGNNPRYASDPPEKPEGPERPRGHIFVWDVTRAMGAEIPHMLGARELTMGQMVDWLRYESSERGWVKMAMDRAIGAAEAGRPVVVIPRDVKAVKLLAMVRPDPPGPDGLPRVAAAGRARGNDLSPVQALGVHAFEYYSHA